MNTNTTGKTITFQELRDMAYRTATGQYLTASLDYKTFQSAKHLEKSVCSRYEYLSEQDLRDEIFSLAESIFKTMMNISTVVLEEERETMIDRMVNDDINSIRDSMYNDDISFLDSVLRGSGWTPYQTLSDDQIIKEYEARDYDMDIPFINTVKEEV